MFECLTPLRVDVVSSLIFCVLSSLSCVLSHFLGCPLPAGVGGVRHMGSRLPRLTHHDTSYMCGRTFRHRPTSLGDRNPDSIIDVELYSGSNGDDGEGALKDIRPY